MTALVTNVSHYFPLALVSEKMLELKVEVEVEVLDHRKRMI